MADTGHRTGIVTIQDYDKGIMGLMKAILARGPNGRMAYWVEVEGVQYEPGVSGKIRSWVLPPESVIRRYILPSVLARRGGLDFEGARNRWQSVAATEYRIPAAGARHLGGDYYDRYEEKPQADPVNISYDLQVHARSTEDGLAIWQHLMRVFRAEAHCVSQVQVPVVDSVGDTRHYVGDVTSVELTGEVQAVMKRKALHIISINVLGELDFADPRVQKVASGGVTFNLGGL